MSKEKKSKRKESFNSFRFRVKTVRSVMTESLKGAFETGKTHFPGLTEHEFMAGLMMALVDATYSILGFSKIVPKSFVIGVIIDLFKDLKDAIKDEKIQV